MEPTNDDIKHCVTISQHTPTNAPKLPQKRKECNRIIVQNKKYQQEMLPHEYQLTVLEMPSILPFFVSEIKHKISNYKHQDIHKQIYNNTQFVSFDYVLGLLRECKLTCHYCHCPVFVIYVNVLESKQWTLDRINNYMGHNVGNVIIACLGCNLKRRRTNKDAFHFTKNMIVRKLGGDETSV